MEGADLVWNKRKIILIEVLKMKKNLLIVSMTALMAAPSFATTLEFEEAEVKNGYITTIPDLDASGVIFNREDIGSAKFDPALLGFAFEFDPNTKTITMTGAENIEEEDIEIDVYQTKEGEHSQEFEVLFGFITEYNEAAIEPTRAKFTCQSVPDSKKSHCSGFAKALNDALGKLTTGVQDWNIKESQVGTIFLKIREFEADPAPFIFDNFTIDIDPEQWAPLDRYKPLLVPLEPHKPLNPYQKVETETTNYSFALFPYMRVNPEGTVVLNDSVEEGVSIDDFCAKSYKDSAHGVVTSGDTRLEATMGLIQLMNQIENMHFNDIAIVDSNVLALPIWSGLDDERSAYFYSVNPKAPETPNAPKYIKMSQTDVLVNNSPSKDLAVTCMAPKAAKK